MARLWSTGFELNSTTADVELTSITGSASISTSQTRTGTYSLTTAASASATYRLYSANTAAVVYARVYVLWTTLPGAIKNVYMVKNAATTTGIIIRTNSSNQLYIHDINAGAQQGSASSALSTNTWYRIEIKVDSGNGVGEFYLDGNLIATATGLTITSIRDISFGDGGGNVYFDDVAVNDNTGSFQNSYPGPGGIIHLRPAGAGANSDWTGTYADIDEIAPDDATTFISAASSGLISDFTIDAPPSTMGATDVISCVQIGVRFGDSPAGSTTFRLRFTAGGNTEESSNIGAVGGFVTNKTASPYNYSHTLYDLPGASTTGITKSDLSTAQVGVNCVTFSSSTKRVSALWVLVDFKPGIPPARASVTSRSLAGTESLAGGRSAVSSRNSV